MTLLFFIISIECQKLLCLNNIQNLTISHHLCNYNPGSSHPTWIIETGSLASTLYY